MPKTVLIVDDSAVVRAGVRQLFADHSDFEVSGEAENGQEAIEKARQIRPDLVILDLSMPVMNGLEAAVPLKKILPGVRMILFTSHSIADLEPLARAAGIEKVVCKENGGMLISAAQALMVA